MIDAKIIMLIHQEKEEIKLKQRNLLLKHGDEKELKNFVPRVFRRMMDSSKEDYDSFIELEKEYVACNQKLLSFGISHKEIMESR